LPLFRGQRLRKFDSGGLVLLRASSVVSIIARFLSANGLKVGAGRFFRGATPSAFFIVAATHAMLRAQ